MKIISFILLFELITLFTFGTNANPIEFDTDLGRDILFTSSHNKPFFRIVNKFEGQINAMFCSMASTVIVLNALGINVMYDYSNYYGLLRNQNCMSNLIEREKRLNIAFSKYTQQNIFDSNALLDIDKFLTCQYSINYATGKPKCGIELNQLAQIINSYRQLKVIQNNVDLEINDIEYYKKLLIDGLSATNHYIIVNYNRDIIGQKGGGHFSPIAAYNTKYDKFLIIDVNQVAFKWVWVDANIFIKSMNVDYNSGDRRGFLVISLIDG